MSVVQTTNLLAPQTQLTPLLVAKSTEIVFLYIYKDIFEY